MARTAMIPRPTVVIAIPRRRGRIRRAGRAVGRRVRHYSRRAAGHAVKALPSFVGGAAIGYGMSKGWLDKLPVIGGSKVVSLGIAGWLATRWSRNQYIRTAGFAAMTVAGYDWGRVQGGGTSGIDPNDPGTY